MTDQPQTYTDPSDVKLTIDAARGWCKPDHLSVSIDGEGMQIPSDFGLFIPTAELLAMIDAEDPDAMRAYLRETAPEVIADHYRPVTPEQLDAVPVADSPEDTDERPDRDDPTENAQLDRSWALDKAKSVLPARDRLAVTPLLNVADWIITGERADR